MQSYCDSVSDEELVVVFHRFVAEMPMFLYEVSDNVECFAIAPELIPVPALIVLIRAFDIPP